MKKNGFLTFIFSFFPGCGQMYQGYMRRGISMLAWFCAILFLSIWLYLGALSIFLVLIWALSFFDSFNIRSLSPEQRAAFRDDFIPSAEWLRRQGLGSAGGVLKGKGGKILGWAVIAVGILLLYNTIIDPLLWQLSNYIPFVSSLIHSLPGIAIALGAIVLGIWLLRGNKKTPPQDDVIPYEGGDENAPQA